MYTYLAGHAGRVGEQGAFRALTRGYTHWASGRLEEMEVNTNHPEYCHVRCVMKPSMKTGAYHVYGLLKRDGQLATISLATCDCAAGYVLGSTLYTQALGLSLISLSLSLSEFRKSASCTHVSALLHALNALNTSSFRLQPDLPAAHADDDETPVTSLPCQWKAPKKRKDSTLRLSEATFEKHTYAKPAKRKIRSVEDFDPRPPEFRGTVASQLPELLNKIRGEQLCISLIFDPQCRCEHLDTSLQPSAHNLPDAASLRESIRAFKTSIEVTCGKAREIERDTRGQHRSSLWYSVRRYRITASSFGSVLSRRPDTPPDSLVLYILQQKGFSTEATRYGIAHEKEALTAYIQHQHTHGHPELVVSQSGFIINPAYSFLGASPDGAVYDPSEIQNPYGFLEIKCPYSVRNLSPTEACATSSFCSELDTTRGQLRLKETHHYYSQVQGQMAIGERLWCDFVVFTMKGVSIQRLHFNQSFWISKLLPKLVSFYDNCVAPEIVSPVHPLGIPIRNLCHQ